MSDPLSYTPIPRDAVNNVLETKIPPLRDIGMVQAVCGGVGAVLALIAGLVTGIAIVGWLA